MTNELQLADKAFDAAEAAYTAAAEAEALEFKNNPTWFDDTPESIELMATTEMARKLYQRARFEAAMLEEQERIQGGLSAGAPSKYDFRFMGKPEGVR